MSAPGRRLTATAASRRGMVAKGRLGLPIRMVTTRRCRLGMAGGPPRDRPATPAGRKHRVEREASLPAPVSRKTVSRAKQGGVAAAVAAAAKDAAVIPAAPQHRPRAAGSRVVRVTRVPAAVAVAAGAQATSDGRRRPSIGGDAMNSLRWQEAAKKTTRDWNSSVSRMSATTATAATTVIQRTKMTPSSRAASTRCSTCRAGWRRSASLSPEISTPAADLPAGETLAVVASRGPTLHHAAAHHRTGRLATHAAAAAQAAINADGNRQNPGSLITIDPACTKQSTPDAEEPVGGTRRSRCILRLTSDARFVQENPVAESAGDEHAAAGEPMRALLHRLHQPQYHFSEIVRASGRRIWSTTHVSTTSRASVASRSIAST